MGVPIFILEARLESLSKNIKNKLKGIFDYREKILVERFGEMK